jgi:hypothetical protein
MGLNQNSWAVVREDGLVETFVRLDVPEGWSPPAGCTVVPDDELPEGWQRVPERAQPAPISVPARLAAALGLSEEQVVQALKEVANT